MVGQVDTDVEEEPTYTGSDIYCLINQSGCGKSSAIVDVARREWSFLFEGIVFPFGSDFE